MDKLVKVAVVARQGGGRGKGRNGSTELQSCGMAELPRGTARVRRCKIEEERFKTGKARSAVGAETLRLGTWDLKLAPGRHRSLSDLERTARPMAVIS